MKNRFCLLLTGLAFLATGCTMVPEYKRPQAPVPPDFPSGAAYREPGTAPSAPVPAALSWQQFITDPKLRQVIATALADNRDLRLAALNVARARALYGIQRAELFPAVNATGTGSQQRIPADLSSSGEAHTAEQYSVNLGILSWEIDFFGRIRSLEEQALQQYLATAEARRSAEILLVSAVAGAYLALAADRQNLKLAESTLEAQQEAYRLIQRRYENGIASKLDLSQAQTQVEVARRNIALYTQLAAQDENGLNLLAGTPAPIAGELLPADLAAVRPPAMISASLSSEVLLSRPDILAVEHQLMAANANIGAARAAFFPRISLTTSIGTASSELSGLFGSGSGVWSFVPQIVAPIFDARLKSAYDATMVQKEIAVTQYEKAIQTAFRDVADTLAVRGTVDRQLAAQQSLVDATAESYRLAGIRYEKGIDSYLSVLDAQRSLYAAQQVLIGIRLAKLVNQVQLYAALGGGA